MKKFPQKFLLSAFATSLVGLGLSSYAAVHHLALKAQGKTNAICNINSKLNCDTVASSAYSEYFGVPVAVYGLAYFAGLLILLGTAASGHKSQKENMPAYVVLVAAGVFVSLGLGLVSSFVIQVWCVVCLATYVVCLTQAALVAIWRKEFSEYHFSVKNIFSGFTTALGVGALVILAFNFLAPQAKLPHSMLDLPGKVDNQVDGQKPNAPDLNLSPKAYKIVLNKSAYSGFGEDYRRGADDAKVEVVEFADFQCPACGDFAKTLDTLHQRLGSKALIVFKNFPLDKTCNSTMQNSVHAHACLIAEIARCAGRYGLFWKYSELAFQKQKEASPESAISWAKTVGLSDAQIKECKDSKDIQAKIKDDIEIGRTAELDGTPSLYINGRKYLGPRDVDSLEAFINSLL